MPETVENSKGVKNLYHWFLLNQHVSVKGRLYCSKSALIGKKRTKTNKQTKTTCITCLWQLSCLVQVMFFQLWQKSATPSYLVWLNFSNCDTVYVSYEKRHGWKMLWHTSSEYNRQIYIVIEGCLRVYFEEQLPNREADHPCSKDRGVLTSERFSRQIRLEKGEVIKDKASEVVGMLHLEMM